MRNLKDKIEKRVKAEAEYILNTESTIREVAKYFGVSKSTVHKDLTQRIHSVSPVMAKGARIILDYNKSMRHIRGGISTKRRWQDIDTREVA